MPTQPLGWFKKEIKSGDDFKGMKYRTVGLSADLFKEMGAAVTILPGGEIVPAMDRGLLDAAEFNNPSSDLLLGFPDVSKFFMVGSHHQQMEALRDHLQQDEVRRAAAGAQVDPEICRVRRLAPTSSGRRYDRYSKDLEAIKERGVNVIKTGDAVLKAQLAAWDKVIAEQSKEPFFAKVIEFAEGLGEAYERLPADQQSRQRCAREGLQALLRLSASWRRRGPSSRRRHLLSPGRPPWTQLFALIGGPKQLPLYAYLATDPDRHRGCSSPRFAPLCA